VTPFFSLVHREMAVGNTFGATALSSYGGFWIAYALLLTPGLAILGKGAAYDTTGIAGADPKMADSAIGLFLTGWFIFTTLLLLCTLRSSVIFFMLFFTLDIAFLMLACGAYAADNGDAASAKQLNQAGGAFGILAAFLAWYCALAGLMDSRYVLARFSLSLSSLSLPLSPTLSVCLSVCVCLPRYFGGETANDVHDGERCGA
jgi:succinate-acetate transporter protein